MLEIALYQPEIPPNTGNIIRLCANTGSRLHLIYPLGFDLADRKVRRAGLDYRDLARVQLHEDFTAFLAAIGSRRLLALSTRGETNYSQIAYRQNDVLLFGPETRGLPGDWLTTQPAGQVLRLPMRPGSRSLNLSNSVAIVVYEAWRQLGFAGAA